MAEWFKAAVLKFSAMRLPGIHWRKTSRLLPEID